MNSGHPKTLVDLNQAILFPASWLLAESRRKGQTPIQSPVNSRAGGKERAPCRNRSRSWEGCGVGYAIPGSVFS